MEAHIASAGIDSFTVDKSNLDKYFKAVLYLALTSLSFTLNLLDDIDPEALGYAFKDMQSNSVNSTKLLFSLLLCNDLQIVANSGLDALKESYCLNTYKDHLNCLESLGVNPLTLPAKYRNLGKVENPFFS